VGSYKIADLLAEEGICSAMWADWWGFKLEAFDGIPQYVALVDAAGACAIVHSDAATGIQRLNQEAAKAMTREPARVWGLPDGTGTLQAGVPADLVVWTGDPLELNNWAERVMIDGAWQDMNSRQTRLFERYRDLSGGGFQYR
jgi:imidazolonepropionase-like amidohydrolase